MTFFVFEEQKSEAQRCHGCVGDVNNRRERAEMLNVVARQDLACFEERQWWGCKLCLSDWVSVYTFL